MSKKKNKMQTIFGSDNQNNRDYRKQQVELSPFCREYLRKKDLFKWFIEKYFGLRKYLDLWDLAERNEEIHLKSELESIWYDLPDSRFNIRVNPPGWSAFIDLLEFE